MISNVSDGDIPSTRGYLIRALHEWCTDNGFTPYLSVYVDVSVQVPLEYVKNNEIVLNVSYGATTGMSLGNELIEFKARFGGQSRDVLVPIDHVLAIYARENGQGMAFPAPTPIDSIEPLSLTTKPAPVGLRLASADGQSASAQQGADRIMQKAGVDDEPPPEPATPGGGRPTLTRIK
jgi:stringent starvation protein B